MAIAYTWDCKTVDVFPTKDDKVNVVHSVHWKYTGTENEYSRTLISYCHYSSSSVYINFSPVKPSTNLANLIISTLTFCPC